MSKLILLRHLKSQWNEENRFSGWVDIPLSKEGKKQAKEICFKILKYKIDRIYTSLLFRNMDTVSRILEISPKYPLFIHIDKGKMEKWGNYIDIDKKYIEVYVTEKLNERYYGKLQGLNKEETIEKYGEKKVLLWRRSYKIAPPQGESLEDVYNRVIPFYKKYIEKDLKNGKNILLVSSHNTLRAILKYIEKINDEDIINFEIPFGGIIEYGFSKDFQLENKKIYAIIK